jgi:hypothetical protein
MIVEDLGFHRHADLLECKHASKHMMIFRRNDGL